jgi:hypothetical protein
VDLVRRRPTPGRDARRRQPEASRNAHEVIERVKLAVSDLPEER